MLSKGLWMFASCLLIAGCQQLIPSYSYPDSLSNREYTCDQLPMITPYTNDLSFNSKYGPKDNKNNRARDQVHKDWAAKYKQQTSDIRLLEKSLSKLSMSYASGKYSAASVSTCMIDMLVPWAEANALLGRADKHTGKSVRKWTLAAISSNYIALMASFDSQEPGVQKVKQWIEKITLITVLEWSNRSDKKVNYHDYWAAWAVMNSAIVLDNHKYYRWALDVYRRAMSQLNSDGLLPNELKRNSLALNYHNYALIPLVMIADLAYSNGDDFISTPSAPINLLVNNVTIGLANHADFNNLADNHNLPEQTTKQLYTSYSLAWIPVYLKYHQNNQLIKLEQKYAPFKSSRLGGNVSLQSFNATQ